MARILGGLPGGGNNNHAPSEDADDLSLDSSIHGSANSKKAPAAAKAQQDSAGSAFPPNFDGDQDLEKLALDDDDDDEKGGEDDDDESKWDKKAKHMTLMPNQYEAKVTKWLLDPDRDMVGQAPSDGVLETPSKKTATATAKKKAKTTAEMAKTTAKAVAKKVQQTAETVKVKQADSPMSSVLSIHVGALMVGPPMKVSLRDSILKKEAATKKEAVVKNKVTSSKTAKPDDIVPEKQPLSPLQLLRSAHKATQLATQAAAVHAAAFKPAVVASAVHTTKATSPQAVQVAKSGASTFEKMEKMADFASEQQDSDAEEDTEVSKSDGDSAGNGDAHEKGWFHKLLKHPNQGDNDDGEDGESIQGFLEEEASALRAHGKKVQSPKRVLRNQLEEQHDAPVVEQVTPAAEIEERAVAAPANAKVGTVDAEEATSQTRTEAGKAALPNIFHDPLERDMAEKAKASATVQAKKGKSLVDGLIKQLGGRLDSI